MGFSGRRGRHGVPTNHERVIEAFKIGKACNESRARGAVWSDGAAIYSYGFRIAWREDDGSIAIVTDEQARAEYKRLGLHDPRCRCKRGCKYNSPTTNGHIREVARSLADAPVVKVAREAVTLTDHAAE